MKPRRPVPDWLLQLTWFLASIYATGALWFFLGKNDAVATVLSLLGAVGLTIVATQLHRLNDRSARFRERRLHLSAFMKEAESLLSRSRENPLPVEELNEFIRGAETYLHDQLDESYAARFGNFSGMTFYSDGSQRSSYENALHGRSSRLHEFITEFAE